MKVSELLKHGWTIARLVTLVSLILASILPSMSGTISVRGSSSSTFAFRDDFNYASMSNMTGSGWTTSGFGSSNSVGNGILSLRATYENDYLIWSNIPSGVSDWTVTLRSQDVSSYINYDDLRLVVSTAAHQYTWTGFALFRYPFEQTPIISTCSTTSASCYPQKFAWDLLTLQMVAGTLSAYINNTLKGSYAEPDPNTYLTGIGPGANAYSSSNYDYITATERTTLYFGLGVTPSPLTLLSQQTGSPVVQVDSRSGFAGSVSLSASAAAGGPTATLSTSTVSLQSGASATSILTVVAPRLTVPEKDFVITITGASGTQSRSMNLTVHVYERTPHTPILIDGNGNFTLANGVRRGSGTATDPYVISDWDIDSSTSYVIPTFVPEAGILIRHTTAYFVILSVYVHSGLKGYNSYYGGCDPPCADGLDLQQVTNGYIEQNTIYWNRYGVALTGSSNITIIGNNFLQNGISGVTTQLIDDNSKMNRWDRGYPVGGNYWSDGVHVDNCSGPAQNVCPNPDGISDYSYWYDRYPLMNPSTDPPVSLNMSFLDVTLSLSGNLNVEWATKTVTGTITATEFNNTSQTVFSKTFMINFTFSAVQPRFLIVVSSITTSLATTCKVNSSTSQVTCMLTRDPDVDHDGIIGIVDFAAIAYAYDSAVGDTRYDPSYDQNADGTITIVDIGIVGHDYGLPVFL